MNKLKFIGFLDFKKTNSVSFMKPVFKSVNEQNKSKKIWLHYKSNDITDIESYEVELNDLYVNNISLLKEREIQINRFKRFHVVLIDEKPYIGYSDVILKEIFDNLEIQKIIKYDNNFYLTYFIINNREYDFFIFNYIKYFSKSKLIKLIVKLLKSNQFLNKKEFLTCISKKEGLNYRLFEDFDKNDINIIKRKLEGNQLLGQIIGIILEWKNSITTFSDFNVPMYEKKVEMREFLEKIIGLQN